VSQSISYCTNWIKDIGSDELSMEKLARQLELRSRCSARRTCTST